MSAVVARPPSPSLNLNPSQTTGSNPPSEIDVHGSEHASDETKLFLGNLPLVITEEEIENVFSAYGPIENIVLLQRPPPKGRSGSPGARAAFVHFQNPASATAAINGLHGKRIFKRAQNPLVVRVADPPRQRGSISSEGSVGSKNLISSMPKLAAYPSATPFAPFYPNQEYTIDAHPHPSYGQGVFSPPQYEFPPQIGFAPPRPTAIHQEQARREPSYATPTGSGAPHVDGEVKLFVGNLPSNISQQALASLFAPFGDLLEVFVFRRGLPVTGAKCAFVRFRTEEAANAAIATLNSAMYSGRSLVVRHATQRNAAERPRSGSLSSAGAPPPLMSQSPVMPLTSPTHPLSSPQVQQHLGHVNLHHVQPPPALHHPQLHHPVMPQLHHQGQFSGYSEPVHHLSPTIPPHLVGPHGGPMSPQQHPHTPDRMHPAVFSPTHQLPPGHQYPAPISPLSHERGPSYYQHSPYYINYDSQAPRVDYPTYENEEKGSDSVSEHDNDSA